MREGRLHRPLNQPAPWDQRAAAAYSAAIKNTSDMMRHPLRIEKSIDDTEKDLPELLIQELTSDEIEAMRKAGREEDALA